MMINLLLVVIAYALSVWLLWVFVKPWWVLFMWKIDDIVTDRPIESPDKYLDDPESYKLCVIVFCMWPLAIPVILIVGSCCVLVYKVSNSGIITQVQQNLNNYEQSIYRKYGGSDDA